MRQGEMHQSDYNKENEIKETYIEENKEMRFNTKLKAQTARGHILHTWDMLLDMGEQGLEITLPQLSQGTCRSQTISSISFGSKGAKTVDVDIITNLGESHYISCGKGAITSRRCLKQRYVELGFTKIIVSDRAVYINNLVTVGPSKPVLTARIIEHAKKRKRQRKTSKQRTSSKAKKQLTTMGIVVGGMRADSAEEGAEEGAEAEHKPGAEITEEEKRGKLLTIYKWKLAQFNMADARKGGGAKWEGLALFMDEHKLHGIALQ
jgi:hypothetical protein